MRNSPVALGVGRARDAQTKHDLEPRSVCVRALSGWWPSMRSGIVGGGVHFEIRAPKWL